MEELDIDWRVLSKINIIWNLELIKVAIKYKDKIIDLTVRISASFKFK